MEVATGQFCGPCHSWNQNIHDAYKSGDYDFEYVEMIGWDHSDNILNQEAYSWSQIYGINAIPTSIFDGDYRRIVGNYPSDLPGALNDCGSRPVPDIVGQLMVIWLGDAALRISVSITNKEGSTYNSYIRVPIMEIVSRYDTSGGSRYNNGFIGYAFYNKDITIEPHGTYTDTVIWDGDEHQDEHGDDFGDISKSNIKVILGVFNQDNGYVDETVTATVHENPATVIDDIPKYVKKLEVISGNTSGANIMNVQIRIYDQTNDEYWDGNNWVSSETWLNTVPVDGSWGDINEAWNYNCSNVIWVDGHKYIITAKGVDDIGQEDLFPPSEVIHL